MSKAIISGRYALGQFRADFAHCSATADLFAQVTANAQGGVRLAVDLLATALNELLEWAWRCEAGQGAQHMLLEVIEDGQSLRVALKLPANESVYAELQRRFGGCSVEQIRERLQRLVEEEGGVGGWLGLYWLASDFGTLHSRREEDGRLALELELRA